MKKFTKNPIAQQPSQEHVISTFNGFTVEVCRNRESLNAAFRVRYRAYLDVNAISENSEELLYDDFDFLPNSFVHLVWFEGRPVATIRGCIFSDQYNWLPTEGINYFPEDIQQKFGDQTRVLESNRFAVDPDFQGRRSLTAKLLLFCTHVLNSLAHELDYIITAVRSNHVPFYRRLVGMEVISQASKYVPWADAEVVLMAVSSEDCRQTAIKMGLPAFDQSRVNNYTECAGISLLDTEILKRA